MTLTQEYALNQFHLSNYHLLPEGADEILHEGAIDVAKDAVQFVVAAAAEYGIVATVAGAPAGPVVETIVDAAFVGEGVVSTAASLKGVADSFQELKDLISKVMNVSLSAGFDSFYQQIKEIWQDASKYVGAEFQDKIDEAVKKAQKLLKKLITKIADTVTDTIKLVIPDATIGTALAEAIEAALKALAANAYSMMTKVLDKAGKFKQLITDPGATKKFFEDAFDWVENTLEKIEVERKKDASGVVNTVVSLMKKGNPGVQVAEKLGDAAISALKSFIINNKDNVIKTIMIVVQVIVPSMFALLASYQILMKGEWKKEDKEEVQEESYTPEYLLKPVGNGRYLASVSVSNSDLSSPLLEFKNKKAAVTWIRDSLLKMK